MRLVRSGWLGNIATVAAGRPPATPGPALFNAPAAAVDGKHPTLLPTTLFPISFPFRTTNTV